MSQALTTPHLRPDVLLRPFDAAAGDGRFVVAVDDRHFVVSAAVAAVLEESRAPSTFAQVAQRASARLGLTVSPEQVKHLLAEQVPSILFHPTEGNAGPRGPVALRRRLAGARVLAPVLQRLAGLFAKRVAIAFGITLLLVELLVAARALGAPAAPLSAAQMAAAGTLTAFGIFLHEAGHLAACRRFGAPHGGIGVGLYWCFPVLYAEVHGAWLLPRLQRAVVDVGGVYFQGIYVLLLGVAYLITDAPLVLSVIAWSHLLMLHTLNPVLKYDGYWLLTDLTGAQNLHAIIRESARQVWRALLCRCASILPRRKECVVLAAFVVVSLAYFSYVLGLLGNNIAVVAYGAVTAWAGTLETPAAWFRAVSESALLSLLVAMAAGVSFLLAQAVRSITQGGSRDQ